MTADVEIRTLGAGDAHLLERVADDVFDHPVRAELAAEFLADPRHHLVVALEDGVVVGFASAFHYVHPDKPAQLFVNEVGVAPSHHRRGIGKGLMGAILEAGRAHGCREAWVATELDNRAARALYVSTGGKEDAPFALYTYPLAPGGDSPLGS